jgi:hypothetical protein
MLLIFCYAFVVFYSFFGCHWIKYVDVDDRTDLDEIQHEVQGKQHRELQEDPQPVADDVHHDNGKFY